MQDEIPLFPVAVLTVGPIPRMGGIIMRPDFLTHHMQPPEECQTGRTYVLSPVQAQYLIERLQQALLTLQTSAPPDGGGPRH